MKTIKYLGISLDAAPTHTGLVVWEDERPISIQQFRETNWIDMATRIREWLADNCCDWVAVEGAYSGKNARNDAWLNKLLGAITIYCIDLGIPCFEGSTAEIDSSNGVYHKKNRKGQNRQLAELIFPGDHIPLTEDECDAIAVGLWGWGKFKEMKFAQEGDLKFG